MEEFLTYSNSWAQLGITCIWLGVIFVLLTVLERILALGKFSRVSIGGGFRAFLSKGVAKSLILYELVAICILVIVFVFINPLKHGLLILVFFAAGFSSLKNFINGRLILLNNSVARADRIRTPKGEGYIAEKGRFGIYLRTTDGLLHVPYTQLAEEGFSLVSGSSMGHIFQARLSRNEKKEVGHSLYSVLATMPYLDHQQTPDLRTSLEEEVHTNLVLLNQKYLPDLIQALDEAGWKCESTFS